MASPQPIYITSQLQAAVKSMDKAFLALTRSPIGVDALTVDMYMMVSQRCREAIRDYYRPKLSKV